MQDANGATDDQLWRALEALCAAAVNGDQDQLEVSRTAFNKAGEPHFTDPCLESAARALLKRALAWHQTNPGNRPKIRFPVADGETDCGKKVTQPGEEPSEPSTEPSPETSKSGTTTTTVGAIDSFRIG